MQEDNVIQVRSSAFAVRVLRLRKPLATDRKERVLSRQLLRSGTSIGASVEEAIGCQSRADFASKLAIAHKETRETIYWLRLMRDTGYLSDKEFERIVADAEELRNILTPIPNSARKKLLGGVVKLKAGASERPFSSFPRRREPRPAVSKISAFEGMTVHLTTRPGNKRNTSTKANS